MEARELLKPLQMVLIAHRVLNPQTNNRIGATGTTIIIRIPDTIITTISPTATISSSTIRIPTISNTIRILINDLMKLNFIIKIHYKVLKNTKI